MPDRKSSTHLYDTWHELLSVDEATDTVWHRLVIEHLNPDEDLRGRAVLEAGCGRGGFACWLASNVAAPASIVAMDYSTAAVSKGRLFASQRAIAGIRWNVGDIQLLPFADDTFDTVVSCEAIEHVGTPRQAVRELGRC